VKHQQIAAPQRALWLLLVGGAIALVIVASSDSPPRIIGGLLLAGVLPAVAMDGGLRPRLVPRADFGERLALAMGFPLLIDLAVGMALAISPLRLERSGVAVALAAILLVVDIATGPVVPSGAVSFDGPQRLLMVSTFAIGLALAGTAYTISRSATDAQIVQARSLQAALRPDGPRAWKVEVTNGASSTQLLAIEASVSTQPSSNYHIAVAAQSTRSIVVSPRQSVPASGKLAVTLRIISGPQRGESLELVSRRMIDQ
jgi:hypothetical protein